MKFFLTIFNASLGFNKYEQKSSASEKLDGNCHIYVDSRWAILSRLQ